MKLLNRLIFVFLVTSKLFSQDCNPTLVITTDFPLTQIFINDSLVSESNNLEIELTRGTYKILVMENSDRYDALTFLDSLTVNDCKTYNLNYTKSKKVYLDTNPQDAYVFRGDSLIGNTPIFINGNLLPITLKKNGYEDFLLQKEKINDRIMINLNFNGQPKEESFFSTNTFYVLTGTAVLLGAITAHYKLKADDKFDEYKLTKNKNLLDETDRYDLISGITFTAMQINIGFILYKLLSE